MTEKPLIKVSKLSHTDRHCYRAGPTLMHRQVKASLAGILGTVLQWYDFSLFGYLSVIIAKTFFPQSNHFAALLSTFGLFAVGFLLAPLGALFFGHIGDRYGRKFTLTISVLLMCIPTTCIALLPGYNHIGMLAPLILTLLRLIQGFVASAEFAGSAIFLVEHGSPGKKSFFGSLTSLSYTIGLILGSFVCTIFTHSSLPSWSWRIPFFLSLFGAILVMYLRYRVDESPVFEQIKQAKQIIRYPIIQVIKKEPRACLITLAMAWFIGVLTYGSYVYMITYLHDNIGFALHAVMLMVTLALLTDAITEPFIALFSEKYGRKLIIGIGIVLLIIGLYPIFLGLSSHHYGITMMALVILSLLIAITYAHANAFLIEQFSPQYRYSGFSVAFNLGITIFGGTTPMILTTLVHFTGNLHAPFFYYLLSTLIGGIAILYAPHTNRALIDSAISECA